MAENAKGQENVTVGRFPRGYQSATALISSLASRDNALRWCLSLVRAQDALPVGLIAAIVLVSVVWNARIGLTWTPALPLATMFATIFIFFGIAAIYSTVLSNRAIAEMAIYFSLWAVFPILAVRLTYLGATLDFPLQDRLFAHADSALGFDWRTWASKAWSYPNFINLLIFAYKSMFYQCGIFVCAFAVWGPRGRNRELLLATIFALLVTAAISTFLPSFGPNEIYGIPSGWDAVLRALRTGTHMPLPYTGIVTFPSFHASMAVLLAASMRSSSYGFVAASIINGLMLLATVPIGYHYFVDLIAGCLIAIVSLYAARLIEHPLNFCGLFRRLKRPEGDLV